MASTKERDTNSTRITTTSSTAIIPSITYGNPIYQCNRCSEDLAVRPTFQTDSALRKHILSYHEDTVRVTLFGNRITLRRNSDTDLFYCPVGNCQFTQRDGHVIRNHVEDHQLEADSLCLQREDYDEVVLVRPEAAGREEEEDNDWEYQPETTVVKKSRGRPRKIQPNASPEMRGVKRDRGEEEKDSEDPVVSLKRATKKRITEEMNKALEGDWDPEKSKEAEARIAGIREFHSMCLKTLKELGEDESNSPR